MTTVSAKIQSISMLSPSVTQIFLKPNIYVKYDAGQYLKILLNQQNFIYSIANAPMSNQYELHIRHSPNNLIMLQQLKQPQAAVTLDLPYGNCRFKALSPGIPILFIAIGTGIAPIKAIIEFLMTAGDARNFELYWGIRSMDQMYLKRLITTWQINRQFNYFTFTAEKSKENLLNTLLKNHRHNLIEWQAVMAGPFEMMYESRKVLIAHGLPTERIFSDAL